MAFTPVNDGDLAVAPQLQQILDALQGVSGAGQPIDLVALDSSTEVALTVRNLGTGGALQVLSTTGTELLFIDDAGVTFGGTITFTDITAANATLSGNLTLSGVGKRITGDFHNGTISNRVMFQDATANQVTAISAIPSGTALISAFSAFNGSNPDNAGAAVLQATSTEIQVLANKTGTGTYLPLALYTNNTKQWSIDTSGNVTAHTGGLNVGTTGAAAGALKTSGAVTAGTSLTATLGDITATNGNGVFSGSVGANSLNVNTTGATSGQIKAGATVTAGTGITATTGNIVASGGNVQASSDVIAVGGGVSAATTVVAGTTVTAGTGITATTGNITASSGNGVFSGAVSANSMNVNTTGAVSGQIKTGASVLAGTTVTAGTGITATTGNIVASSGQVQASSDIVSISGGVAAATTMVAGTGITATTGNITASSGNGVFSGAVSANSMNVNTTGAASGELKTAAAVRAGTTVTAGTGITATTGNIVASAGQVQATSDIVSIGGAVTASTNLIATTGNITASAGYVRAGTKLYPNGQGTIGYYLLGPMASVANNIDLTISNNNPIGLLVVTNITTGATRVVVSNGSSVFDIGGSATGFTVGSDPGAGAGTIAIFYFGSVFFVRNRTGGTITMTCQQLGT